MKIKLILFLFFYHILAFGQNDTLMLYYSIPVYPCAHSHICCNVGCECCPDGWNLRELSQKIKKDSINVKSDVSKRYVGETFDNIAPYSGWSEISSGLLSAVNPWELEDFYMNPYDNHPYLEDYQYSIEKTNKVFYRIVDGYKYSGEYTDSTYIREFSGEKEIYFKANYKDGLLEGFATFYFTSQENTKEREVEVGDIKAEGYFQNGVMIGKWKYYGYYNNGISPKVKYQLAERIYSENNELPINGKNYTFYEDKQFVGTEYCYSGDTMLYCKFFDPDGQLYRIEQIVTFKKTGANKDDYIAEYEITAFHLNNTVQATGNNVYIPGKSIYKLGLWVYYNEDGIVIQKGNYQNDNFIGIWEYFYDNGNKKCVNLYENGKTKLLEYWDETGKQLVKKGKGEIRTEYSTTIKVETVKHGKIKITYINKKPNR